MKPFLTFIFFRDGGTLFCYFWWPWDSCYCFISENLQRFKEGRRAGIPRRQAGLCKRSGVWMWISMGTWLWKPALREGDNYQSLWIPHQGSGINKPLTLKGKEVLCLLNSIKTCLFKPSIPYGGCLCGCFVDASRLAFTLPRTYFRQSWPVDYSYLSIHVPPSWTAMGVGGVFSLCGWTELQCGWIESVL